MAIRGQLHEIREEAEHILETASRNSQVQFANATRGHYLDRWASRLAGVFAAIGGVGGLAKMIHPRAAELSALQNMTYGFSFESIWTRLVSLMQGTG